MPWRPLVSAAFCMAGAALAALQGVGCTPWRPLVSAALPVTFAWQAQHLVLCKGSDVRPGVPCSPLLFAWRARHLVLCKGSDVRPGVPWSPLLLRGRRSTCCSARGRMYALASLGLGRSAGSFCVAGATLAALQGVGCTPWRPLVSAAFCVAGAALAALQGVGCTPWRPLVSAAFCMAGAALGALQGVGCTHWRPLVSATLLCSGHALQEQGTAMYQLSSFRLIACQLIMASLFMTCLLRS